jgi:hypothetical protein
LRRPQREATAAVARDLSAAGVDFLRAHEPDVALGVLR